MKIIICLLALGFSAIVYGQPGRIKANPKKPPIKAGSLDSMGDKGMVRPAAPATNGRTRQPRVNKTKLDDLKNPFDTGKVIQQQPPNVVQDNGQHQRTATPPVNSQQWRDDSLLWIKNKQKPPVKVVSGATNPGAVSGNNRRKQPAQPRMADSLGVTPGPKQQVKPGGR